MSICTCPKSQVWDGIGTGAKEGIRGGVEVGVDTMLRGGDI